MFYIFWINKIATSNFTRYNVIYTRDVDSDDDVNYMFDIDMEDVGGLLVTTGATYAYDDCVCYNDSRIIAHFNIGQNSRIHVIATGGYYVGYSFDYVVDLDSEDEDRRIKTIQKQTQTTINKIKRAFKKAGLYELRVQWTASNGETGYQKI